MRIRLDVWNRNVGNGVVRVVGKRFWYRDRCYGYKLGRENVEVWKV